MQSQRRNEVEDPAHVATAVLRSCNVMEIILARGALLVKLNAPIRKLYGTLRGLSSVKPW
jgi:hypothetical protein